jgi:hypothetical protein
MAFILQNFCLTDSTARPAKQPLMSAKMGVRFRIGAFPVPQPAHGLTVKVKFISSFWTRFAPEELGTEWNRGGHGAPPFAQHCTGMEANPQKILLRNPSA